MRVLHRVGSRAANVDQKGIIEEIRGARNDARLRLRLDVGDEAVGDCRIDYRASACIEIDQ